MGGMAVPAKSGIAAWPSSALAKFTGQGMPSRPFPTPIGLPNDMRYAHSVQTISVIENAYRTIRDEFSAHLRFIRPEYRMARPGTLWMPTRVAAVSCHPVSPAFSQLGPETMSRNMQTPSLSIFPEPAAQAADDGGTLHGQASLPGMHRAFRTR